MTEPTEERPLVTFALFAYNQERFIREAVEGALAQTYSPLQVILSDDCSSDRTFEIMQEMVAEYSGPHEILLNRNERNLGIGGHVNRLMELAKGELIVGAAGDDISESERTKVTVTTWKSEDQICSIHSLVKCIDENSIECGFIKNPYINEFDNPFSVVNKMAWVTGSSHAWSRKVFNNFGKLSDDIVNEDMVIALRSSMTGKIRYIDQPLVRYRVNVGISSENIKSSILRIKDIPYKQAKRKLAVLKQYKKDREKIAYNDQLVDLINKKIIEEEINIKFIESGGKLRLVLRGIRCGINWLPLFKNYLKHKLPTGVLLLNYRLRGL